MAYRRDIVESNGKINNENCCYKWKWWWMDVEHQQETVSGKDHTSKQGPHVEARTTRRSKDHTSKQGPHIEARTSRTLRTVVSKTGRTGKGMIAYRVELNYTNRGVDVFGKHTNSKNHQKIVICLSGEGTKGSSKCSKLISAREISPPPGTPPTVPRRPLDLNLFPACVGILPMHVWEFPYLLLKLVWLLNIIIFYFQ